MNKDYFRFFYILLIALIIGLIFDHIFLCLFLATLGCLIWQQQKLSQLFNWIQNKNKSQAPDVPGYFEDICIEIDRLQLRHKKRKKKLSGFLQQFHQATSALPDATVVLDEADGIQWANKAAGSFLNIYWPQDQRQRITNLIRSPELERFLSDNKRTQQSSIDLKSPLDSEVFLSIRVVPYGENQRLFVARDITRLQKLIEVRKDFVANVSHELRTPLTVLRGYLETLVQNKRLDKHQLELSFSTMNDQSIRMESVINDLLTISRLEEDRLVTDPEDVVVPEMIKKIHQEAVTLSGKKQHLFNISVQADLWIKGNSMEIYSAFSNLVFNAVRYTPSGGVIGLNWFGDEHGAHMEITDNGVGIPPQSIPRLTERFYRVEQSRGRDLGGSGLGLSIVKHVLARHNATLHIESIIGKGSVFRCDFPEKMIAKNTSKDFDQQA
ncbi:MAG: phosphate regulon sensor histidine kinase PhoR [Gammaproteobacteria bacterium]